MAQLPEISCFVSRLAGYLRHAYTKITHLVQVCDLFDCIVADQNYYSTVRSLL